MMEMRITVNIPGLERLAEAVLALAGSRTEASPGGTSAATPAFTAPVPVQAAAVPVTGVPVSRPAAAVPMPQTAPQPISSIPQQTVPVQQPAPTAVPTSTASYTMDDLARAGTSLMDVGRQADLQQLLARFGVEALPGLPPAQYGAFATALREMGAQI